MNAPKSLLLYLCFNLCLFIIPLLTEVKSQEISYYINLATIYNLEIKKYDLLIKELIYQSQSTLQEKEYMYGINLSTDIKNFIPYKNEPMTGTSLMYSIKTPLNNKDNYQYIVSQINLLNLEKLALLNEISKNIKQNIININYNQQKLKQYSEIQQNINEIIKIATNNYKYSKSRLSEIYNLQSMLYSLALEKISIESEIKSNILELYSLVNYPVSPIYSYHPISIQFTPEKLINNPSLKLLQYKINTTTKEIYIEKNKQEKILSVEYMFRPNLPSMLYFKYSISLPNKNQQKMKIISLQYKIESIKAEIQNQYNQLYYKHQYLKEQINYQNQVLQNIEKLEQNYLQQLRQLKLEYEYNKSTLTEIILLIKEIKELKIKKIQTQKEISQNIIEIENLYGKIN